MRIASGPHELSPFVLNLKWELPSPEEILEDAHVRLNLLHPSLLREPVPGTVHDTLKVHRDDIEWQLGYGREQAIKRTLQRQDPLHPFVLPSQTPISLDAFYPKTVPENIVAYFDIPEEEPEEQDESELVEFKNSEIELQPPSSNFESGSAGRFPSATFQLFRPIAAFVAISFVFVLPLHAMNLVSNLRETNAHVSATSKEALTSLASGLNGQALERANARFGEAQSAIEDMGVGASLLLSAIPSTSRRLSSGRALLEAGERLTTAGARMTDAMQAMEREVSPTPVSRIRLLLSYLKSVLPHLTYAEKLIEDVNEKDIPEAHRETFQQIAAQLPRVTQTLEDFAELSDFAIQVLGGQGAKRYLLLFQNNTEIRATGGFMGSFAELKVRDGVIENLSVPGGGTYDLQGLLRTPRVSPAPLQLLSARWEFQDANWFPDFPTSARQVIAFYRDAGGPSVDGVIAVNATFIADLIGLLGPVEMEGYGRTINAENFLFEAQKIVEVEYNRTENKPKQFIGDLAPKLIERALAGGGDTFLTLADALSTGLSQKNVQVYFTDETAQRTALARRWGGALLQPKGDYLMVVNTNLGGGKTDGVIEEDVDVQVEIQDDGSTINTVTVTRTHKGIKGSLFTGVNNVNYVRLYVPRGSELIEADGFDIPDRTLFEKPEPAWALNDDLQYAALTQSQDEATQTDIYEEHGKTVFGNWVQTSPGETSIATFRYRVPMRLFEKRAHAFPYALTVQKQAGTIGRRTTVSVAVPASKEVIWKAQALKNVTYQDEADVLYALLLK